MLFVAMFSKQGSAGCQIVGILFNNALWKLQENGARTKTPWKDSWMAVDSSMWVVGRPAQAIVWVCFAITINRLKSSLFKWFCRLYWQIFSSKLGFGRDEDFPNDQRIAITGASCLFEFMMGRARRELY